MTVPECRLFMKTYIFILDSKDEKFIFCKPEEVYSKICDLTIEKTDLIFSRVMIIYTAVFTSSIGIVSSVIQQDFHVAECTIGAVKLILDAVCSIKDLPSQDWREEMKKKVEVHLVNKNH